MGSSSTSVGQANLSTTPTSSRSMDGSGKSASISTGFSAWRMPGRRSSAGDRATTGYDPTARWATTRQLNSLLVLAIQGRAKNGRQFSNEMAQFSGSSQIFCPPRIGWTRFWGAGHVVEAVLDALELPSQAPTVSPARSQLQLEYCQALPARGLPAECAFWELGARWLASGRLNQAR